MAIARSLVLEPRILMFDEPLSNLDFKLRIQMREELRNLQRRLGKTSIYVTHDQTEALALSDRIAVLSHGRIEQIGTPAEIYERPASAFVAEFIGSSNMLRGRIVERGEAGTIVATETGLRLRCRPEPEGEVETRRSVDPAAARAHPCRGARRDAPCRDKTGCPRASPT